MTGFWMIRHALVEENARARLYGITDVEICPDALITEIPTYAALARMLPRPAHWVVTPLSRTVRTAAAIWQEGYPEALPTVEPDLIEQNLGAWQGLTHAQVPAHRQEPAHPFWPLSGSEVPPGGESMAQVIARVGGVMERLAVAHPDEDVVIVSHGGTIRAAVAHALGIGATHALHLQVWNLSLTRMERLAEGWRVVCVNAMAGA